MKVVIIDDELHSRENLRNTLNNEFPELEIVGEAFSVDSGISLLSNCKVDLVFLDIDLGPGSGFNILEQLDIDFEVVFVTAYNEYAIRAIKFSALDYILKPINGDELSVAIKRARERIFKNENFVDKNAEEITNKYLGIKEKGAIRYVKIRDIMRCRADKNYTEIYLKNKERVVASNPLKRYTELLEPYGFFRIHQSHLINLKKVKRILREDGVFAELENGELLEVSRRKKEALLKKMREFQV